MAARIFRWANAVLEWAEKAGKHGKKGRQDTSHAPNSPKALVFQRFGAGASVGERAARKKKTKDFNESRSASADLGRKAVLP